MLHWIHDTEIGKMHAGATAALATQTQRLDAIFRYYVYIAAIGEARHAAAHGLHAVAVDLRNLGIRQGGRRDAAQDACARAMTSKAARDHVITGIIRAFQAPGWLGGFGGRKWAVITELLQSRFRHLDTNGSEGIPADVWIDGCFDIVHNGGRIFDKRPEIHSRDELNVFLDGKFAIGRVLDLAKWIDMYGTARLCEMTARARVWIQPVPATRREPKTPNPRFSCGDCGAPFTPIEVAR